MDVEDTGLGMPIAQSTSETQKSVGIIKWTHHLSQNGYRNGSLVKMVRAIGSHPDCYLQWIVLLAAILTAFYNDSLSRDPS